MRRRFDGLKRLGCQRENLPRLHAQTGELQRLETLCGRHEPVGAGGHGGKFKFAALTRKGPVARRRKRHRDAAHASALRVAHAAANRAGERHGGRDYEFLRAIALRRKACALQQALQRLLRLEAAADGVGRGFTQRFEREQDLGPGLLGKREQRVRAMAVSSICSSWRAITCCATPGEVEAAWANAAPSGSTGEMLRRFSRLIARRRAVV